MINPITHQPLLNNSPITKYLLYSCYYDKNIKEIKILCDTQPAVKINYNINPL